MSKYSFIKDIVNSLPNPVIEYETWKLLGRKVVLTGLEEINTYQNDTATDRLNNLINLKSLRFVSCTSLTS